MENKYLGHMDLENISLTEKYRKYDLLANPFPMVAISADTDLDIPILSVQNNEELQRFIASTYMEKKFGALAIVGEFGFGKTYMLKYIHNRINEGLYNRGKDRAVSIFIESPRPSVIDFALEMLRGFGIEKFLKMLWRILILGFNRELIDRGQEFIDTLISNRNQFNLLEESTEDIIKNIPKTSFSSPLQFIDLLLASGANLDKISEFIKHNIYQLIPIADLSSRLGSLSNNSRALKLFTSWRNFIDDDFKRILKKNNKEKIFISSFLNILFQNGFRMVYVLIDECENMILAQSKSTRMLYFQNLREIFDMHKNDLSVIIATTPESWHLLEKDAPAFRERFSRKFEIENINAAELKILIAEFLSRQRLDKSDKGKSTYPFTEDAIKEILLFSKENLRICLESCFALLEYAVDNDEIDEIDADLVKKLDELQASFYQARGIDVNQ